MALKRSSEIGGGSAFFKPAEFEGAAALLIEPKSLQRDVDFTPYQKTTVEQRDEVTADVTAFATEADLKAGKGVEHKAMTFTHKAIVNRLGRAIGEAVVGKMGKEQFKNSAAPAWVVADVDDDTFALVEKFYDAREEAVKAALEDVPSFD
jgi:hypothetical protein